MAMEGSSDDFAISVAAYWNFVEANGLQKKIAAALDEYKPATVPSSRGSSCARGSIRKSVTPDHFTRVTQHVPAEEEVDGGRGSS